MKTGRLLLLLALVLVAGCSDYATPDTSSVGLAYTGGDYDEKKFEKCVPAGGNERIDWAGTTAYYPQGTRTWDFSDRSGADSGPILVSTSNNQELIQGGTITFTLDTSCTEYKDADGKIWPGGKLQKFHETIGRSKGAFFGEDSTVVPQGWKDVLTLFLGGPANRVMDDTGAGSTWQNLYSDKPTVDAFTKKVIADLPAKIKDATGGDEFFHIISVQLDKPTVPEALRHELEQKEVDILAQDTASQKRAFQESWPGGIPGYQAFQHQEAETKCLNEGRCPIVVPGALPVPK